MSNANFHPIDLIPKLMRAFIVLYILGAFLKILHIPWADYVILLSAALLGAYYAFRFVTKDSQKSIDIIKLIMILSWSLATLFRILQMPYADVFTVLFVLCLITWFLLEGRMIFGDFYFKKPAKNRYSRLAFILAVITAIIGVVLKILHSPGADLLLIAGMLFFMIWLILVLLRK